ncbi:MAG: phenylalanine--tRNA ligase subunit beta [Terriglobales bacterium]
MKISPQWVREFVDLKVDDRKLAEELTLHGIAVEGMETDAAGQVVYEVEFTSNRPDVMNHYGVARECAAIFDVELKPLQVKLPAMAMAASAGAEWDPKPEKDKDKKKPGQREPFPIAIEDAKGCARYTARIVRGVTIKETPEWMVRRLESVEQRSINNVADASNYVLWEMGHPTHAFDLDLLEGAKIIVRRAREGESLRTLDGVERKLSKEDLVIADAVKPVALAGVMGGFDSMITEKTRNVLIESAWFDPVTVRKTARRHGLHTDASHRFERGADWGATPVACARVAQLILESAGGTLEGGEIDAVARTVKRPELALRRREVLRILGKDIEEVEIERTLRRLGFGVTPGRLVTAVKADPSHRPANPAGLARDDKSVSSTAIVNPPMVGGAHAVVAEEPVDFTVQVPTWRLDVEREIDLIEEIARIHGYENFPNTLPEFAGAVVDLPDERKDARLRRTLLAQGYDEAVSLTFIGEADARAFTSGQVLTLENPISDEAAVMRTSLLPGMLQMLAYNLNRGNNDVRLFEAGHVFEKFGERADERKRIAMGATGNVRAGNWAQAPRAYTFFDMKGDIEQLLEQFECRSLYFDQHAAEFFHPGRAARAVMDGSTVARFGQLHPEMAAARKLRQDVYIGEIYLDRLYQHALREPQYTPIPRYPAVDRDFSFMFDDAVTFERIRSVVEALKIAELRSFAPVEIFRGGAIPAGKYSVLLRAEFQSPERTLTDQEVAVWAQQIIEVLEAVGGALRA